MKTKTQGWKWTRNSTWTPSAQARESWPRVSTFYLLGWERDWTPDLGPEPRLARWPHQHARPPFPHHLSHPQAPGSEAAVGTHLARGHQNRPALSRLLGWGEAGWLGLHTWLRKEEGACCHAPGETPSPSPDPTIPGTSTPRTGGVYRSRVKDQVQSRGAVCEGTAGTNRGS